MRLVHLSDLHLGFRQYQRLTPGGVNQREADVAATFRTVIDRVIALRPDVVVIAGDVFHTVRPTNQAILHAFLQFSRLVRSLPDAVIVMIAGNHDTPRSTETGGILQLLAQLGIMVVDREAKRLPFPDRDLSILAVPDVPGLTLPSLVPESSARYNVLVLHGEVEGMLPAAMADRAGLEIKRSELGARWDYIALGHYHVYREIAPNAFYSGSIDYTSANPWGEISEQRLAGVAGKGIVERNLDTGEQIFHSIAPARPLVDLPPVNARGLAAADLNERIRATVESVPGGIDSKIVRLTVREVPRHMGRELDHKAIREYKRRALNFHLDLRRPEAARRQASGGPGGGRRQVELKEVVLEKLRARPLDADVDREALLTRASQYIDEAQAISAAAPLVVDG